MTKQEVELVTESSVPFVHKWLKEKGLTSRFVLIEIPDKSIPRVEL